ncbi:uncharacterized protein [Antedon mediterranea]|uniref:uncharacterized protein isoform X2 n=1 Tax=Antedon mediterranea TaxID=105859 RepID=UPI003AF7EBB7
MASFESNIEFRNLKFNLGKHYKDEKCDLLKFCLLDYIPEGNFKPDYIANDLFNLLHDKGVISADNVCLLLEVAELSDIKKAVDLVSQYMKDNDIKYTDAQQLSPYRRRLFTALIEVGQDTFKQITAYYELSRLALPNIWRVVFFLERELLLEDKQEKITQFANLLTERARNILLDNGVEIEVDVDIFNPVPGKMSLRLAGEVYEYCKEIFTKIREHFKRVNASLSLSDVKTVVDPNTSLLFSLDTDSRSALSELMDIQSNGQLIRGLAKMFVMESQQRFLDNWKTIIDDKALKELLLVKNQGYSSVDDRNRQHALEIFFNNLAKQKKAVIGHCDSIMKTLTTYFKSIHLYFKQVGAGSLVLYLTAYDSEALENLWEAYCNKTLQRDLAKIVAEELQQEFQSELLNVKIDEDDLKSAMRKVKEIKESEDLSCTSTGNLPTNVGEEEEVEKVEMEISVEEYNELLTDTANWYDQLGYLKALKLLYKDHLKKSNVVVSKAESVWDLLQDLTASGSLSSSNLTILYDTIKITKQFGFKSNVKNQPPEDIKNHVVSMLTSYRQRLFQLGLELKEDEVAKLDFLFNNPLLKNYPDSWSLIKDFEDRKIIDRDYTRMEEFLNVLERNRMTKSRKIFLDGCDIIIY